MYTIKSICIFLLLLFLLPLGAVFLLKLIVLAGSWTVASLNDLPYAIVAAVVFLLVIAGGIWFLVDATRQPRQPVAAKTTTEATVYCNTCGKINCASVATCHYCHAHIGAPEGF